MFAPSNSQTQLAYAYTDNQASQAMTELGLTPTPLPTLPAEISLPDGRRCRMRHEFIGGAMDEPGNDRIVFFVRP